MAKMLCSLCGKDKKAEPLDMDDPLFGRYVRAMRFLRLSMHTGPLGVCGECMPAYRGLQGRYQQKLMFFGVLGVVFAALYLYFTGNILASLAVGVFLLSLSLLQYCPPLKDMQ